jgi:hypothetical protein
MSGINVTKVDDRIHDEALKVKARLARLRGIIHLGASLPASIEGNSSLLPEISRLSFESNTHNLVRLVLLL